MRHDMTVEERAELEADLDTAVFKFFDVNLRQQVNPLLHFAAILGINDTTGGWSEAQGATCPSRGCLSCLCGPFNFTGTVFPAIRRRLPCTPDRALPGGHIQQNGSAGVPETCGRCLYKTI